MTPQILTRRAVLAAAGCAMFLSRPAAANPWAPRQIRGDEREALLAFQSRLMRISRTLGSSEIDLFRDHLRLRMGESLLFEPRRADLSPAGVRRVTALAQEMRRQPDIRVEIVGHHHFDGQRYQAFIVSSRRAMAVKAALLSRGVPEGRLLATGLGDAFPIAGNDTPDGRARNRRVELVIRPL